MKFYSYIFMFMLLVSCRQEREEKPATSGHEAIHAKKTPFHLLSPDGDTIPTGVPIPAKGKWINPDSVARPKTVPLKGKPRVIPAHDNIHPVGKPRVVPIPEELTVVVPGIDGVPLPDTVTARGKVLPAQQPQPVPALPPRFKDNAIYDIQYLEVDQGMNHSYILSILEDGQGYLWFGAFGGGVSRFDGSSFIHYTTEEGLSSDRVWSILEDSRGNLWFGTAGGGVTCYDGKSFIHYTEGQGLSHNSVSSIIEDSRGHLWFGTFGGGVSRFDGQRFVHYTENEGLSGNKIFSMLEDQYGNIWFATWGGGVSCFDGNRFTRYSEKEGFHAAQVWCMLEDKQGDLWFGALVDGLIRYDGKSFAYFTAKEGLSHDNIKSMIEDSQGDLWFGTDGGGVVQYNGQRFIHYTTEEGLNHNRVSCILEDSQGNIWFGTFEAGVSRYNRNSFRHYNTGKDSSHNTVTYLQEDHQGDLWFGSFGGGVSRYDGKNFTLYNTEQGLNNNNVGPVLEDRCGDLWFGTFGGGVSRYDGERFIHYSTEQGLSHNIILSMLEDSKGNLWFGTQGGGVSRYDGNSFFHYTMEQGLSNDYIGSIIEDRYGSIWFGTYGGGVSRYDPPDNNKDDRGRFIHYTEKEGLSHNVVLSMLEDDKGNLWAGTDGGGVSHYDGTEFIHYTTREGLNHNSVRPIQQDKEGNLWLNTGRGITLMAPLAGISESEGEAYRFFTFGKREGLKRISLNFSLNSSCLGRNNCIWWGMGQDLVMLDLNNFELPTGPPRIRLNHIEVKETFVGFRKLIDTSYRSTLPFGESLFSSFNSVVPFYNYPTSMDLPHDLNHLTFHFSAVDWAAPHKIKYSYKLKGLDDDWSIPKSENKADYRNLPFGDHTLKVKAIGAAQVWSQPFEYTFTIRPPWWRTWWAYSLYTLVIAAILFAIYRFLLNRQLELAETRRLKELDAMKATFYANITHEFRTPLTIIQGMANQLQRNPGRWLDQGVTAIRRSCKELLLLVNQILDLSKLEAGHLQYNPVHGDIIPFLRYLMDSFHSMAQEKGVALSFKCEHEHLEMDFDQNLISHIVSNLLSNGLKFTPQNGTVLLRVRQSVDEGKASFLLEVEDNGQGIPADQLPHIFDRFYQASSIEGQGGTGIGLALVKEVVDLLGGKIDVESQVGKGTAFAVSLPITRQAPPAVKNIPLPSIETGILAAEEALKAFGKPIQEDAPLILLVEDNEGVIRYLNSLLCHRYRLDKARNGREGLDKATEIGPDLIISDVMMPEMDGYAFCEKIKADKATSHIPVILLTARATHEGRKEGLSRGADAYIVKPFDQEELFIRIEQLLGLRQKLKERYWNAARLHLLEDLDVAPRYAAFLEKLDEHIWENIDNPAFKVDQMAAAMYMSRSALFTELKKITGKSPSDYLRDARLALADQLVRNTDLPLNQVAERTGFSSDSYLTKVYRKKFGASPSEVRGDSAE